MLRSKKTFQKPESVLVSENLAEFRKKHRATLRRHTSEKEEVKQPNVKENSGFFSRLASIVRNLAKLVLTKSFCLDEIIAIFRPLVYVYAVFKYGRKSSWPLKLSFALDVVMILISLIRLWL